jgi:chemotaxis protein histidine kinase CheA
MARRDITGAVDFPYLEAYAGGNLELVDEVLGLFREQARCGRACWTARAGRDAVHTLKGSGRGVGAFALADACEAAEDKSLDSAARAVRLDAVRSELDRAIADIAAYAHERALQGLRSA